MSEQDDPPERPPTRWARVLLALVGIALGLALIWFGLSSFEQGPTP